MLRRLYSALTSERTLDMAFEDLTQMLEHGQWMFERANAVLHSQESAEDLRQPLYDRDQAINELERSVRRKLLRHLTVNPGHDVAICLALMSVTKDAERIGDYCKNVFEVGTWYREGFHVPAYQEPLDQMSAAVTLLFSNVIRATRESNETLASQTVRDARRVRGTCDDLIRSLLREDHTIEFHEAVAYSLLARHYKRVAAHLANIATAVLGQLEDLDFYPDEESE